MPNRPQFDIDEGALPIGVEMLVRVVEHYLDERVLSIAVRVRQGKERGIDDVPGVDAGVVVQVGAATGLAELVHPEWHRDLTEDGAKERQGVR